MAALYNCHSLAHHVCHSRHLKRLEAIVGRSLVLLRCKACKLKEEEQQQQQQGDANSPRICEGLMHHAMPYTSHHHIGAPCPMPHTIASVHYDMPSLTYYPILHEAICYDTLSYKLQLPSSYELHPNLLWQLVSILDNTCICLLVLGMHMPLACTADERQVQ